MNRFSLLIQEASDVESIANLAAALLSGAMYHQMAQEAVKFFRICSSAGMFIRVEAIKQLARELATLQQWDFLVEVCEVARLLGCYFSVIVLAAEIIEEAATSAINSGTAMLLEHLLQCLSQVLKQKLVPSPLLCTALFMMVIPKCQLVLQNYMSCEEYLSCGSVP
jgi:hypothetical protein